MSMVIFEGLLNFFLEFDQVKEDQLTTELINNVESQQYMELKE